MFPKYQNTALDGENRAKKRVIKSLAKAYLNENVSLDVGSSDTAVQIYDKLENKLNFFKALISEALTYFASQIDETTGMVIAVSMFGLIPLLGRLLIASKEIAILSKQLAPVFSYLENDQVNNLSNLLSATADELIYLEEGIKIAVGLSDDPEYEGISKRPNAVAVTNIIEQIVSVCDGFSEVLTKNVEKYTPAVISMNVQGGNRRYM